MPVPPAVIAAVANRIGVPPQVFARLVNQESGGNQGARSPAGAIGLTQLMPGTARGLGVDPYNAQQNLEGGARYLKQQLQHFHSLPLALAAYNAGPGAVEAAHGVPHIRETQNYVAAILRGLQDGGGAAGGAPSSPTAAAAGAAPDDEGLRRNAVLQLIESVGQKQPDFTGLLSALQAYRSSGEPGSPSSPGTSTAAGGTWGPSGGGPSPSGGIAELLREGTGGPTHSTGPHIHAAFNDPNLELAAIQWATQHGLHVGENPYVGDTVDPVHAPHSFHTRNFPGLFHGRQLGQAIDVTGPQSNAFYQWLQQRKR